MTYTIKGSNFHGPFEVRFRGPSGGFRLSQTQERRLWDALCGISDCVCGGAVSYGDGLDIDSAAFVIDYDRTGPFVRVYLGTSN